ncbi:YesL family protein [Oceanobacillus oncorhynchi subsp. oncorhynchi]|uniref:YesL family protein n=1 Tax=Oceanobacillus oncorhynchi TaxID=545501 RepID=UPI0031D09EE2
MASILGLDGPVYRFLMRGVELALLNILFILCSVPLLTIGAAISALYTVTLKMVRGEEGSIVYGFWKAFKSNFKQSTIVWVILFIIGGTLTLNYILLPLYTGHLSVIILMGLILFSVVGAVYFVFLFPYMARYTCTIKEAFGNVLKLCLVNPYPTLLIICLVLGPAILTLFSSYLLALCLYFYIFIGFALIAYISSFKMRNLFEKYE